MYVESSKILAKKGIQKSDKSNNVHLKIIYFNPQHLLKRLICKIPYLLVYNAHLFFKISYFKHGGGGGIIIYKIHETACFHQITKDNM